MSFYKPVFDEMERLGLSQNGLSALSGVNVATVNSFCNGGGINTRGFADIAEKMEFSLVRLVNVDEMLEKWWKDEQEALWADYEADPSSEPDIEYWDEQEAFNECDDDGKHDWDEDEYAEWRDEAYALWRDGTNGDDGAYAEFKRDTLDQERARLIDELEAAGYFVPVDEDGEIITWYQLKN